MNDERTAWRPGEAFATSREDRDRTLVAIHRLESALAMAAGGETWAGEVATDLRALEAAMVSEEQELHRPDALLSMIAAENPRRFGPRIRSLRAQYADTMRHVESLAEQLDHPDGDVDPTDLRQRAALIMRALRHCRERQADLVYEALNLDLGER